MSIMRSRFDQYLTELDTLPATSKVEFESDLKKYLDVCQEKLMLCKETETEHKEVEATFLKLKGNYETLVSLESKTTKDPTAHIKQVGELVQDLINLDNTLTGKLRAPAAKSTKEEKAKLGKLEQIAELESLKPKDREKEPEYVRAAKAFIALSSAESKELQTLQALTELKTSGTEDSSEARNKLVTQIQSLLTLAAKKPAAITTDPTLLAELKAAVSQLTSAHPEQVDTMKLREAIIARSQQLNQTQAAIIPILNWYTKFNQLKQSIEGNRKSVADAGLQDSFQHFAQGQNFVTLTQMNQLIQGKTKLKANALKLEKKLNEFRLPDELDSKLQLLEKRFAKIKVKDLKLLTQDEPLADASKDLIRNWFAEIDGLVKKPLLQICTQARLNKPEDLKTDSTPEQLHSNIRNNLQAVERELDKLDNFVKIKSILDDVESRLATARTELKEDSAGLPPEAEILLLSATQKMALIESEKKNISDDRDSNLLKLVGEIDKDLNTLDSLMIDRDAERAKAARTEARESVAKSRQSVMDELKLDEKKIEHPKISVTIPSDQLTPKDVKVLGPASARFHARPVSSTHGGNTTGVLKGLSLDQSPVPTPKTPLTIELPTGKVNIHPRVASAVDTPAQTPAVAQTSVADGKTQTTETQTDPSVAIGTRKNIQ